MTTIKFRRDTSANWTSVNPIPAQGEPCYETDTGKLKIGNGSDNYTTLPYVSDGGGSAGDLPIATATTLGGVKIGNNLSITEDGTLSATGGSTGTTDYTQLENKPQINSVELTGNKTLNDLGIQPKGNYLTALPDNVVTTDADQTIEGVKTFTQDITASNIVTTANGTIKLAHPTNAAGGLMTISNNYGQLSISTISDGNNLLSVARGTLYVTIDADKIVTKDASGNFRNYINSQNIDTTYMKWDDTNKKLAVDTAAVAHLAMPSDTVVNLTLGASGTGYTPPSDGWVKFTFWDITKAGYMNIAARMELQNSITYTGGTANVYIPVSKGETFRCYYDITGSSFLKFYYAEGAAPTST